MGIRGFMTLIESRLSHCGDERTVLKRGSVFCVDGTCVVRAIKRKNAHFYHS